MSVAEIDERRAFLEVRISVSVEVEAEVVDRLSPCSASPFPCCWDIAKSRFRSVERRSRGKYRNLLVAQEERLLAGAALAKTRDSMKRWARARRRVDGRRVNEQAKEKTSEELSAAEFIYFSLLALLARARILFLCRRTHARTRILCC
jgi:hypothetical protein